MDVPMKPGWFSRCFPSAARTRSLWQPSPSTSTRALPGGGTRNRTRSWCVGAVWGRCRAHCLGGSTRPAGKVPLDEDLRPRGCPCSTRDPGTPWCSPTPSPIPPHAPPSSASAPPGIGAAKECKPKVKDTRLPAPAPAFPPLEQQQQHTSSATFPAPCASPAVGTELHQGARCTPSLKHG